ncbi:MAG TPA: hypothetical protein VFU50_01005 [Terriglobales bacterium]|nr:hypothetical protein [Terriglobales bacterium]
MTRPAVSPVPIKSDLRKKLMRLERVLEELNLSHQDAILVVNYVYRLITLSKGRKAGAA